MKGGFNGKRAQRISTIDCLQKAYPLTVNIYKEVSE